MPPWCLCIRVWSSGRAQTGRCLEGQALPWVTLEFHHRHPASACHWSQRCPLPRWWLTWGGGRHGQWPPGCQPCLWWHHLSGSAGWSIASGVRWQVKMRDEVGEKMTIQYQINIYIKVASLQSDHSRRDNRHFCFFNFFIKKNVMQKHNSLDTSVGSLLGTNNYQHMVNLALFIVHTYLLSIIF